MTGTQTISKKQVLKFTMQRQETLEWCWAAVGTSTALFYDPSSGWTQGSLVSKCISPPTIDCTGDDELPKGCYTSGYLDYQNKGAYVTAGVDNGSTLGAISFNDIKKQIDDNKIIGIGLSIDNGGHFVVIDGYETRGTNNIVYVKDPLHLWDGAANDQMKMPYDELVNNYQGNGKVTVSYLTRSSIQT